MMALCSPTLGSQVCPFNSCQLFGFNSSNVSHLSKSNSGYAVCYKVHNSPSQKKTNPIKYHSKWNWKESGPTLLLQLLALLLPTKGRHYCCCFWFRSLFLSQGRPFCLSCLASLGEGKSFPPRPHDSHLCHSSWEDVSYPCLKIKLEGSCQVLPCIPPLFLISHLESDVPSELFKTSFILFSSTLFPLLWLTLSVQFTCWVGKTFLVHSLQDKLALHAYIYKGRIFPTWLLPLPLVT